MLIRFEHSLARRIFFPVFNLGVAAILAGWILFLLLVGIWESFELSAYMFVFSYLIFVLNTWILGLAPASVYIPEHDLSFVRSELDSSPNLSRIAPNSWAPKWYKSSWWKSDRITIGDEICDGLVEVKARYRDLDHMTRALNIRSHGSSDFG